MVKYTVNEAERNKLQNLLDAVKALNVHINESKRKKENTDKLYSIQKRIGKPKKVRLSPLSPPPPPT